MISRTAAFAIVALLGGAVSGPAGAVAVPASAQSEAVGVRVPVVPAERAQPTAVDAADLPDGSLAEVEVVVPAVTAGEIEESPEVMAGRADASVVVADDVVADRVASEVVETDGFQTLGVTWPEGSDVAGLAAQVRVRADGEWSGWLELEEVSDAPDAGTADAVNAVRGGTDPLWVGDADAVQLSFAATPDGGPDDMALVLVGSEEVPLAAEDVIVGSEAVGEAVIQQASYTQGLLAAVASPAVISRAAWGARAQVCTPDVATQLVGAAVHHTAGSNDYATVAQAMQQIRNDQRYHIESRGWCDLGYNFVVDKWGNIYEGRANSLTQPVIGVHSGGFNTGTVGVSMLGTYDAAPSAATQQSVAQIIGWRLGYYGVAAQGSMTYHTGVGENSKYQNQDVTLPRVFGHRDVAYTACPGNGGYAALADIRVIADSYSYGERFRQAGAVVQALYADLLGRGVDPAGMQTWSDLLVGGAGGPVLVATLTGSDEYIVLRIRQAYLEVLGREPEATGLADWYRAIRAGAATVDDVQRRFLSSAEFMFRAGGTNEGYVRRMYASVLGRAASPSEVTLWVGQIGQRGREWVTDAIWFSLEAASWRAGAYYQTFLKRAPDPEGQATWARVLLTYGEGAVRIGIAGSEEYRMRALARYP